MATQTTPQNAIATQQKESKTTADLLKSDAFKGRIETALPKHLTADRMIGVALTTLQRTPLLAKCTQASFFNAMLSLSQFGLEPDGRNAHLIPFKNNKTGQYEVQLILDYKGLVELAMRSGKVANIHADVVCENDEFEYNMGEVKTHKVDFRKPRGDVYAVYCVCTFKDGTKKAEAMSREEVEAIRRRSRAGQSGPWVTDWAEMSKKTVFKRLSKWLPLSPEFRDAVQRDDDTIKDITREVRASSPLASVHLEHDDTAKPEKLTDEPEAETVAGQAAVDADEVTPDEEGPMPDDLKGVL